MKNMNKRTIIAELKKLDKIEDPDDKANMKKYKASLEWGMQFSLAELKAIWNDVKVWNANLANIVAAPLADKVIANNN